MNLILLSSYRYSRVGLCVPHIVCMKEKHVDISAIQKHHTTVLTKSSRSRFLILYSKFADLTNSNNNNNDNHPKGVLFGNGGLAKMLPFLSEESLAARIVSMSIEVFAAMQRDAHWQENVVLSRAQNKERTGQDMQGPGAQRKGLGYSQQPATTVFSTETTHFYLKAKLFVVREQCSSSSSSSRS